MEVLNFPANCVKLDQIQVYLSKVCVAVFTRGGIILSNVVRHPVQILSYQIPLP